MWYKFNILKLSSIQYVFNLPKENGGTSRNIQRLVILLLRVARSQNVVRQ